MNSLTLASGSSFTVSGTTNIPNGININGAGSFTLSSANTATLEIGDVNGITNIAAEGNIQVTGSRTYGVLANYVYNGTGGAQVAGNQLPTGGINNLTIANTAGVALSGSVIVNGTLALTSGSFAVGANTLTLNGPNTTGTPANMVTTASSNLIMGGTSTGVQIPAGVNQLNTLDISNSGTVSMTSSIVLNNTAAGALTLNGVAATALSVGANTLTLDGGITYTTAGPVIGGATSSLSFRVMPLVQL